MFNEYKQLAVIILAAGRGVRLNSQEIPKPLRLLNGRPLISYILSTLKKMSLTNNQIWIVIHHLANQIKLTLGPDYQYTFQKEINGTAGALADTLEEIPSNFIQILVLQSDDSMFYQAETLKKFIKDARFKKPKMSLITLKSPSKSLGSLIRDSQGQPKEIWPQSKCEENHFFEKELVTGVYLFDRVWVSQAIKELKPDTKGEIGLPYLIEIAYQEKQLVTTFELNDPNQWVSINTPEELEEAEKRINPKLETTKFGTF